MIKYFFIFIFLISFTNSHAKNKDKIIEKLQNTKNLVFEFEQNINGKIENGNCTIQYPKKIYCKYLKNNKILVSNSKSLVIKTLSSYYRYPLKKTPLNLILDKNFLIEKINDLGEGILDETYINFAILENNNVINIFFDINHYLYLFPFLSRKKHHYQYQLLSLKLPRHIPARYKEPSHQIQ